MEVFFMTSIAISIAFPTDHLRPQGTRDGDIGKTISEALKEPVQDGGRLKELRAYVEAQGTPLVERRYADQLVSIPETTNEAILTLQQRGGIVIPDGRDWIERVRRHYDEIGRIFDPMIFTLIIGNLLTSRPSQGSYEEYFKVLFEALGNAISHGNPKGAYGQGVIVTWHVEQEKVTFKIYDEASGIKDPNTPLLLEYPPRIEVGASPKSPNWLEDIFDFNHGHGTKTFDVFGYQASGRRLLDSSNRVFGTEITLTKTFSPSPPQAARDGAKRGESELPPPYSDFVNPHFSVKRLLTNSDILLIHLRNLKREKRPDLSPSSFSVLAAKTIVQILKLVEKREPANGEALSQIGELGGFVEDEAYPGVVRRIFGNYTIPRDIQGVQAFEITARMTGDREDAEDASESIRMLREKLAALNQEDAQDGGRKVPVQVVGMIGVGRHGKRLLNTLLHEIPHTTVQEIHAVARSNYEDVKEEFGHYPSLTLQQGEGEVILTDEKVQAVVIATPAETHYTMVKHALQAGKHVFVEKPFTLTPYEAQELTSLAQSKNLTLMVGHTLLYAPLFQKLKAIVDRGDLGPVQSIETLFLNPYRPEIDYSSSAFEDLGYHDLYMVGHLLDTSQAPKVLDVARSETGETVTAEFLYGWTPVTIQVSREHEGEMIRTVKVSGEHLTAIFDHQDPNRIVIRPTTEVFSEEVLKRLQTEVEVAGELERPLGPELRAFIESINTQTPSLSDAISATHIVQTVTAVEQFARDGAKRYSDAFLQTLSDQENELLSIGFQQNFQQYRTLGRRHYLLSDPFLFDLSEEGLDTPEVRQIISELRSKKTPLRLADLFYVIETIRRAMVRQDPARALRAHQFADWAIRGYITSLNHPNQKGLRDVLLRASQFDPSLTRLLETLLEQTSERLSHNNAALSSFIAALNYFYFIPHGFYLMDSGIGKKTYHTRTPEDLMLYDVIETSTEKLGEDFVQRIVIDHPDTTLRVPAGVSSAHSNHIIITRNSHLASAERFFQILSGEKEYTFLFTPPSHWPKGGERVFQDVATKILRRNYGGVRSTSDFVGQTERRTWEHEIIHKIIQLGLLPELHDYIDDELRQDGFTYPWELTRPGGSRKLVGLFAYLLNPEYTDDLFYGIIEKRMRDLLALAYDQGWMEEPLGRKDLTNPFNAAQALQALGNLPEGKIVELNRELLSRDAPRFLVLMDSLSNTTAQDGGNREEAFERKRRQIEHDAAQDPLPLIIEVKQEMRAAKEKLREPIGAQRAQLEAALIMVETAEKIIRDIPDRIAEAAQHEVLDKNQQLGIRDMYRRVALSHLSDALENARRVDPLIGLPQAWAPGQTLIFKEGVGIVAIGEKNPENEIPIMIVSLTKMNPRWTDRVYDLLRANTAPLTPRWLSFFDDVRLWINEGDIEEVPQQEKLVRMIRNYNFTSEDVKTMEGIFSQLISGEDPSTRARDGGFRKISPSVIEWYGHGPSILHGSI